MHLVTPARRTRNGGSEAGRRLSRDFSLHEKSQRIFSERNGEHVDPRRIVTSGGVPAAVGNRLSIGTQQPHRTVTAWLPLFLRLLGKLAEV